MDEEEEEEQEEPGRKHTRKEAEVIDLEAGEDLTPEGEEEEEQELLDEEAEALDEDVPYSESGGRFEEEEAATARGRADAIGGIPARKRKTGQKKAGGDTGTFSDETALGNHDFEQETASEGGVSARTGRSSNPVDEADVEHVIAEEDLEEQEALPRSRAPRRSQGRAGRQISGSRGGAGARKRPGGAGKARARGGRRKAKSS